MSIANLSNQIRLMNRMVKRDLSTNASLNDWLIQQVATVLDSAGTQSILDLVYYANEALNVSFFFDQKTGHVFTYGNQNTATYNAGINGGNLFWIFSRDGRENDKIYLFFTKDGFPVFWNISEDTGSDWTDIRTGLIFVGSIVLSAVGAPIMSQIGTAVLGPSLAASYPALAQGIGQACMSTLMNGGDIEKGVTSAVASYVGAGVGGQVASATGADIIGQASAAATKAFIMGGDPESAVAQSLIQNGVSSMGNLLLSGAGDTDDFSFGYDDLTYDPGSIDFGTDVSFDSDLTYDYSIPDYTATGGTMSGNYYTDENGITYGVDAQGDLAVVDFVDDQGIGYATDAQGDLMVVDAPTSADISQSYGGTDSNGTVQYGSPGASSNGLSVLTPLATTALTLLTSYVKAGMPAVRAGTPTATVNANGTITTRNANGTTTVSRPAAGTPYVTAGGSMVTNNGDGTYTTVNPNGTISTQQYGSLAASAGGDKTMLYVGLGALAVLALASR